MQPIVVVDRKTGEVIGGPFQTPEELRAWMKERIVARLPLGVIRRHEPITG